MVSTRRDARAHRDELAPVTPERVSWRAIWLALASVPDPEIPVLSVLDLGVLRSVEWDASGREVLVVRVTPTYTGCPATDLIIEALQQALRNVGVDGARVERVLSPPWSTSWMTPAAQRKLMDYGIAPPGSARPARSAISVEMLRPRRDVTSVPCPRCGSLSTEVLAPFGSTPCKAQYRCRSCLEPFDFFKAL